MSFTIRAGAEADIPVLMDVERDAAQSYRAVGYDFCADGAVRDVDEHLHGIKDGALLVAETCDGIAGFILLWPIDGHAHITELAVAERFQKRGIGRALINAGEAWARAAGYSCITLTTFTKVAWNAPFYRTLDYEDFTPGPQDKDLAAVQAEEAAHGFHVRPRTAMAKRLES